MSTLGKKIRMSRLVDAKSDKMMAITVDHAISRGIASLPGIHSIQETIDKIVKGGPDAITMTKGIAEACFYPYAGSDVSLLLKCSSYSPVQNTQDTLFGDVEEALLFGADGCSIGAMVLGQHQGEQMRDIGRISKECLKMGMPLVAHIYPKGESVAVAERTDWENIAYGVRMGAELGADIIKTTYTGDPRTMEKVVNCCPTRVVIQGGNVGDTIEDYMKMTRDALDVGVGGVTFGRFVWSYKDVTSLVKALKSIIHDNASVKDAMELLKELENENK